MIPNFWQTDSAKSAHPDQTAPRSGSFLSSFLFASLEKITIIEPFCLNFRVFTVKLLSIDLGSLQ